MTSVLHRNLNSELATAVSGQGVYLTDQDNRQYIDASGGAAVSCLGHNNGHVNEKIYQQLEKVAFAHTTFFTNAPAENLADRLIARAPQGIGAGRVMFLGSGSEAIEASLKLALQYQSEIGQHKRTQFIARTLSYHGNTLGALSIGGHPQRRKLYEPSLIRTHFVSPCSAYRGMAKGETESEYVSRLVEEFENKILEVGAENIAAFIAEPIAGATLGSAPPATGYLAKMKAVCVRNGILFIADEVMCGSGRTGTFFAQEQEGFHADITTLAKGLGAGFQPISAIVASEEVVDAIAQKSGQLANGHTYMSHAVACAGALAVLDVIENENLLQNVQSMGDYFHDQLRARFSQNPHVGDIRGRGLFWSLELVKDRETKTPFGTEHRLAAKILQGALGNGMICYPSSGCIDGTLGDHVLLAPPYIVSEAHIDEICDKLERTISKAVNACTGAKQ